MREWQVGRRTVSAARRRLGRLARRTGLRRAQPPGMSPAAFGGATAPAVGRQPKRRDLARLHDVLACPVCHAHPLRGDGASLSCRSCGAVFRVIDGVPVLRDGDVKVMPLDHVSNQLSEEVVRWLSSLDGLSLNLGAGATDQVIPNCVELEYSIFRNTDVAADAHRLPFKDEVFEAVVTFNTFEHLRDPAVAAQELNRVLKPGGRLMLQTAFIQPLHEEPHHYYNVTEWGLRRWFGDFSIDRLFVPENMNVSLALAWLVTEVMYQVGGTLGERARQDLAAVTLGQVQDLWTHSAERTGSSLYELLMRLPPESQKRFSGGFQLEATKAGGGSGGG